MVIGMDEKSWKRRKKDFWAPSAYLGVASSVPAPLWLNGKLLLTSAMHYLHGWAPCRTRNAQWKLGTHVDYQVTVQLVDGSGTRPDRSDTQRGCRPPDWKHEKTLNCTGASIHNISDFSGWSER